MEYKKIKEPAYNIHFIKTDKFKKIRIKTEKEVSWSLDGEFGGKSTDCKIEVVNQRIDIKTGLID